MDAVEITDQFTQGAVQALNYMLELLGEQEVPINVYNWSFLKKKFRGIAPVEKLVAVLF